MEKTEQREFTFNYGSSMKGLSNLEEDDPFLLYVGFTYKIKARDLINKQKMKDLNQRKLNDIRALIANPPAKCEFYEGGKIERYDIYEPPAGDIIVMIRVPFKLKS